MRELAALDLALPKGPTGAITFHPEWRGIWIRNFKEIQGANAVDVPVLQVVERK
jgi:hypothetical protein